MSESHVDRLNAVIGGATPKAAAALPRPRLQAQSERASHARRHAAPKRAAGSVERVIRGIFVCAVATMIIVWLSRFGANLSVETVLADFQSQSLPVKAAIGAVIAGGWLLRG